MPLFVQVLAMKPVFVVCVRVVVHLVVVSLAGGVGRELTRRELRLRSGSVEERLLHFNLLPLLLLVDPLEVFLPGGSRTLLA